MSLPYDPEVMSSFLGLWGNSLVFGQKLYGEFCFYHRVFAQMLPCDPHNMDVMMSLLGYILLLPLFWGKLPPTSQLIGGGHGAWHQGTPTCTRGLATLLNIHFPQSQITHYVFG